MFDLITRMVAVRGIKKNRLIVLLTALPTAPDQPISVGRGNHIPKHTHEKSETHFLLEGSHMFENNVTGERFEVNAGGYFYLPGRVLHEAWVPTGARAIIILESGWKVDWLNGP